MDSHNNEHQSNETGSDLVFLNELCLEGKRTFRFGKQLLEFEQIPLQQDSSGVIWPASIRLANLVYLQESALLKSLGNGQSRLRVLELGCGTFPLVSLACAAAGMDALATDLPHVIHQASRLIAVVPELNLHSLDWTRSEHDVCTIVSETATEVADFDLITGADVLYNEKLHDALAQTIRLLLSTCCKPTAFMLLCWQLRRRTQEEEFFKSLAHHGLTFALVPRTKAELQDVNGMTDNHFKFTRIARIFLSEETRRE